MNEQQYNYIYFKLLGHLEHCQAKHKQYDPYYNWARDSIETQILLDDLHDLYDSVTRLLFNLAL